MIGTNEILLKIKSSVIAKEPNASIILFGSFARNEQKKDSDIDILILIDKENLSNIQKREISHSLYDIEFETGQIISPIIFTRNDWENRHKITPFYENVKTEGKYL